MSSAGRRRILLIGDDPELLRKRIPPLEQTGAHVVLSGPAELETHVGNEVFDLLILCHTLSDLSRRCAIENAQRRWPRIKILQIYARRGEVTSIGCRLDDRAPDAADQIAEHAREILSRLAQSA